MPADRMTTQKVVEKIDESSSFLITGTAHADGDSIGAQLALRRLILKYKVARKQSCTIEVINEDEPPPRYQFVEDADLIQRFSDDLAAKFAKERFDMAFVLDGGSERCGTVETLFDRSRCCVLVDHHRYGSEKRYDLSYADPDASSTTTLIYQLFDAVRDQVKLDKAMAAQIYLGIIFDTGFFRHPNTTPKTMRIAAELMETGFDFPRVALKGLIEADEVAKRLLGHVLGSFSTAEGGRICWASMPWALFENARAELDHSEGIVEQLIAITGVEVAFLLIEQPDNSIKISFRSKGGKDVGRLARGISEDGGGHKGAAGCRIEFSTLDAAEKSVLDRLLATEF